MRRRIALALTTSALALILSGAALAAPDEAPIQLGGRTLFTVTGSADRAERANQLLNEWLHNHDELVPLQIELRHERPTLMLGSEALLTVTPADARLYETKAETLATEWAMTLAEEAQRQRGQAKPDNWGRFLAGAWNLMTLLCVLLGGAIAAWLINWGTLRLAEDPKRYRLPLSGTGVTVLGGAAVLAVAVATLAASLSYMPIRSVSVAAAVVAFGAMALIASAEMLGNLAGGLIIALTPLFAPGDYVRIGGHAGRVRSIGLFFTRLETERHGERLVPNGAALRRGVAFVEGPQQATMQVTVRLAYTVQPELAQAIIVEAALRTRGVADEPMPECLIAELEDETVRYDVRAELRARARAETVTSHFHVNLLDVLAENDFGPGGLPMPRTKLRIGMAPANADFHDL